MLNIAIIGCGHISAKHINIIIDNVDLNLACVCDLDTERASAVAHKYSVKHYTDHIRMLDVESIDCVVVLTPSGTHSRIVHSVAKYGLHIVVEKPIALTIDDTVSMIRICEEYCSTLHVIKQNRLVPAVALLKDLVANDKLGKIALVSLNLWWCRPQEYYDKESWRGTWKHDGGVLCNQAIHYIDILQWVFGDISQVFCVGGTQLVDIEAEDTAALVYKFASGAICSFSATTCARPKNLTASLSILSDRGHISLGGNTINQISAFDIVGFDNSEIMSEYTINDISAATYGHERFYRLLPDIILNKKLPLVDGAEALKSLRILIASYESMFNNEVVSLIDHTPKFNKLGL